MTDVTLFFGGGRPDALAERVARGRHPRVDCLDFLETYGADLVTFDDVRRLPRVSPYWCMAWDARTRSHGGIALVTGEDAGLPLALVQRLTGGHRPVFIITHGSYFGSWKGTAVLRLLRADPHVTFLCLSESLRRRLIERHGVPEARAVNAGYGVDTQFFRPPDAAPEPGLLVAAGMANRDYRTLVAAVTGLDVTVRIAADSAWFRADLDIAGQALPPNVSVGSSGDYVGLRDLYARASLVVVPLYPAAHACGYAVIAEAMAMGRPVIATRTDSPSDYVVEEETGFLVPPGDVAALRARLSLLLARPALAAGMGENARRRMERQFTLEGYNARIASALNMNPVPQVQPHEQLRDRIAAG